MLFSYFKPALMWSSYLIGLLALFIIVITALISPQIPLQLSFFDKVMSFSSLADIRLFILCYYSAFPLTV